MRICFVCSEFFVYGHYGGFGKLTRDLANGLVDKGVEVYVLMRTLDKKQRRIEVFDNGIIMIRLPRVLARLSSLIPLSKTKLLYRLPDADIYHSEAANLDSYFAMKYNPKSKHIITFQDPRTFEEKWAVLKHDERFQAGTNKKLKQRMKNGVLDVFRRKAIHNADRLYCQARFIIPRVVKMYGLKEKPMFLPNPVKSPERRMKKADKPTVCFLARWDAQKRVEMFLSLAKDFPDVHFITMGKRGGGRADEQIRQKYSHLPNLEMVGFVSEEEKSKILERSWALVNTSIRECLPVSFIEALVHETPIVSGENPDFIVSDYGVHTGHEYGDYVEGLEKLLSSDWRQLGKKGRRFVKATFEHNLVIQKHIEVYRDVLA